MAAYKSLRTSKAEGAGKNMVVKSRDLVYSCTWFFGNIPKWCGDCFMRTQARGMIMSETDRVILHG
jgi:hypothetical protein